MKLRMVGRGYKMGRKVKEKEAVAGKNEGKVERNRRSGGSGEI